MNDALIQSLLYRSEDTSVDFKAEQYVISKLDETKFPGRTKPELAEIFKEKKSELLKDLLAMANSWRDGPAYILIGFKENKPHPPDVLGIEPEDFHDDAVFQQFVNSKVNRTLEFKYEVRSFNGKTIGVITIPTQKRPIYAKVGFGKVAANTVYIRRGSSTGEANPTEVADMGSSGEVALQHPSIALQLHNQAGDELSEALQKVVVVDFGDIQALPDYYPVNRFPTGLEHFANRSNSHYWRELAEWIQASNGSVSAYITITNNSSFSVSDCKLEITVTNSDGSPVGLTPSRKLPRSPSSEVRLDHLITSAIQPVSRTSLDVEKRGNLRTCIARIDKALPGESVTLENFLALAPKASGTLRFKCRMLAHELKTPLIFEREIQVEATHKAMTVEDLKNPRRALK